MPSPLVESKEGLDNNNKVEEDGIFKPGSLENNLLEDKLAQA
jgi:hypothetical protein